MSSFNSSQPVLKPKKRQSQEDYEKDHRAFREFLRKGTNPREIRHRLGLSISQYNKHMVDALTDGEEEKKPMPSDKAIIKVGSLHPRDRKELENLQSNIKDSDLLCFEKRDESIICKIITVEPKSSGEGV